MPKPRMPWHEHPWYRKKHRGLSQYQRPIDKAINLECQMEAVAKTEHK